MIALKELKDLLAVLRKAGVTHFTSGDLALTLTETPPPSSRRRGETAAPPDMDQDLLQLSEEEALFWSTQTPPEESE
jgi:hypothetical protein